MIPCTAGSGWLACRVLAMIPAGNSKETDMTKIKFVAMPTEQVQALRAGGLDSNGQPAELATSNGPGNPCRHCLEFIPEGKEMLILGHRPFPSTQPYAETGPLFVCADDCARWEGDGVPPIFQKSGDQRLLKGYSPEDRIVYGLGRVVDVADIAEQASTVLNDPRVDYVHVRSSTNNCFTCRVEPA